MKTIGEAYLITKKGVKVKSIWFDSSDLDKYHTEILDQLEGQYYEIQRNTKAI